jgi:type IV secretion system protein VirB5
MGWKFLFVALLIQASMNAIALLPVIDMQSLAELSDNYQQLRSQYQLLTQQYEKTSDLVSEGQGHYLYGSLYNTQSDIKQWQWSPDSWNDALEGLSGGNPERYQQLIDQYQKDHPTLSHDAYQAITTTQSADDYQEQVNTNRASKVSADYVFADINQRLKEVHDLSANIENTKNDKAALDLNSRLVVELSYIQLEMLKVYAVINEQGAEQQTLNISEKTQAASFNTIPGGD